MEKVADTVEYNRVALILNRSNPNEKFVRRCSIFKDHDEEKPNGGVAQLGEHLPCKQGVMGSNPIISTNGSRGKRYTEGTYMGS